MLIVFLLLLSFPSNVPDRSRKVSGPNESFYELVAFLKFQCNELFAFFTAFLLNKGLSL